MSKIRKFQDGLEGLAQYYTVRVLDRLKVHIPEARVAYDKLLPHQPAPCHTHLLWLKDFRPEEVRDALVTVRRAGIGSVHEHWKLRLENSGAGRAHRQQGSPRWQWSH